MSKEHIAPLKPIASGDVAWTEFSEAPRFALRYRHLSHAVLGEDYRIGVVIEELAPGMRSAPRHYHIFEEEHVFILEGELTLRLGRRDVCDEGRRLCLLSGRTEGRP
ncbi:MAG TPA: hypothetical protein VL101_14025 [Nordella sp.]|nr:hypothetical protein [Nordella sp.]